jgi:hypothetical protein
VSKEAWPTVKKYSPVWIPVLVAIVATVDIVNNSNHREIIENVCPPYVELVRKYIGFEDEDPEEINRVKQTISAQLEPVDILIELSSGARIVQESVDGNLRYGDFYRTMQSKYNSEGWIRNITFMDRQDIVFKELDLSGFNDSSIDSGNKVRKYNGVEIEYKVAPMINSPLGRSLWDTDVHTDTNTSSPSSSSSNPDRKKNINSKQLDCGLKSSNSGGKSGKTTWSSSLFGISGGDSIRCDKEMILQRYDDYTSSIIFNWKKYKKVENINRLLIRGDPNSSSSSGQQSQTAKRGDTVSSDRATLTKMIAVTNAKQTIVSLEKRIEVLKNDRKRGIREIDQIDTEIKGLRNEIILLKRKHLNYFYFF